MSSVPVFGAGGAPALPVGSIGRRASGWWGMLTVIATEAALFAYLLFGYYYVGAQSPSAWPPGGPPPLALAAVNTVILLASSGLVVLGERAMRADRRRASTVWFALALLAGIVFVAIQGLEWSHKSFTPSSHAYGSHYFAITGFHMAHVAVGLVALAAIVLWSVTGFFDARRHAALSIGAMYWHFVDVVWLAVFTTIYLVPRAM